MARWKKISDIKALPCYSHIPTRLLYLHLCMICNPVTGEFSCSLRDMAYECKMTLTNARTALKNLIRDGLIVNSISTTKYGTTGILSAYVRPQQKAEQAVQSKQQEEKVVIDIDYVLKNEWLKDLLPGILASFPLTKYAACKAGQQFVQEMRSIGKTWKDREDVRRHHLSWLQKEYLGIKTKKELQMRKSIFDNEQRQKKGE